MAGPTIRTPRASASKSSRSRWRRRPRRLLSARRASSMRCRCRRAIPSVTRRAAGAMPRARPARAYRRPGRSRRVRRPRARRPRGRRRRDPGGRPPGPNRGTARPAFPRWGWPGRAPGGLGLLLDIRDVTHPVRLDFAADPNMSFWHSATFNNDGKKLLFSDEWGGGSAPRCRDTDKLEWGADALFSIENNKLKFHSYYKMPAPQTAQENCVAHNGSLIPLPAPHVIVHACYHV